MAEETIWLLGIDGEEALSTLDAIDAALATVLESMNNVAGAASGLSSIDAALASVSTSADDASTGVGTLDETLTQATVSASDLDEAMASMQSTIAEDTTIIDSLNEAVANLEGQLAALSLEEDTADASAQSFGDSIQAAQGQLLMIGVAGIMAGKSLYDAGVQGQQGIELVQGMAGATTGDVQNLEQSALSLGDSMDQASAGFYQVASAGYTGKDAITVFTAATEAAKGAQTDLQPVSTALTSIMAAYGENASQAKTTTDQMTEAVFVGKQSFDAFASAIGPLAATGHNVGLSFAEVAAAEATMTQINPNVRQDTMELNSLFTNMDMSMDKVAQTAKKEKLAFDETHYSSLNLIDKLKYLADISGGTNTVAFQKMVGGMNGVKAALALLSNQGNTYTSDLQKIQNSQGATDAKFAESEQTIKAHTDHMAAAFSVFSTKFMDAVGPHLIPILDNLGKAMDFLSQHMDIAMPIAAGLAVLLGGVLVTALIALLAPLFGIGVVIAGTSVPLLAIAAGIALVVAGIALLVTHWSQITGAFQNFIGGIGAKVTGFFDFLAHKISGTTDDAKTQANIHTLEMKDKILKNTEEAQKQAIHHFDLMREGILNEITQTKDESEKKALEIKLSQVTTAEKTAVEVHKHTQKMRQDTESEIDKLKKSASDKFGSIGKDIQTIVGSVVTWLKNAWDDAVNWVVGKFVYLYEHSYLFQSIVDNINKAVTWVEKFLKGAWETVKNDAIAAWNWLVSKAEWLWDQISAPFRNAWNQYIGPALTSLWNTVSSTVSGWVTDAWNWGVNLINSLAAGITNAVGGALHSALTGAANLVKSLVGWHSPTQEGPGADSDKWAPAFVDMFATGLEAGIPRLQAAVMKLTQPIALGFTTPTLPPASSLVASPTGLGGNDQTNQILQQILIAIKQQQQGGNLTMNNTLQGGSLNSQMLNQLMQVLSGYGYESTNRGVG